MFADSNSIIHSNLFFQNKKYIWEFHPIFRVWSGDTSRKQGTSPGSWGTKGKKFDIFLFDFFLKILNYFLNYFSDFQISKLFDNLICSHHTLITAQVWSTHSKSSNFPAGHPSSHCSSPSTLKFLVLSRLVSKSALIVFLTIVSYQSY
jgi:hypothetical protein